MRQPLPVSVSFHELGGMKVSLQRKPIRHVYIRVVPPDGEVRVSAPWQMPESSIREILESRLAWIRLQQSRVAAELGFPPDLVPESGPLPVWGQPVSVRVEGCGKKRSGHVLQADGRELVLFLRNSRDIGERNRLLEHFYRQQIRWEVDRILPVWVGRTGSSPSFMGIRKMQTRWGSCHPVRRRVWLNLALARYPHRCLEYVLVHELVHFRESGHNSRFRAYMDHFLPEWREIRKLLDFPPLR